MKHKRDLVEEVQGVSVKENSFKEIPNPFKYNINPYTVNRCGVNGSTLLYNSIKNDIHKNGGYYKKVEYLVEVKGADINKGKGYKSPLYKAIFEGNLHTDFVKIAKFLIEKGARNDYMSNGMTPLHLAAITCSVDVLEAFAKNGYDFTLKAGPERDITVINLILDSKVFDEKSLHKALASIPVEQLPIIWNETITNIDLLKLSIEQRVVIDCFVKLNNLTYFPKTINLNEGSEEGLGEQSMVFTEKNSLTFDVQVEGFYNNLMGDEENH